MFHFATLSHRFIKLTALISTYIALQSPSPLPQWSPCISPQFESIPLKTHTLTNQNWHHSLLSDDPTTHCLCIPFSFVCHSFDQLILFSHVSHLYSLFFIRSVSPPDYEPYPKLLFTSLTIFLYLFLSVKYFLSFSQTNQVKTNWNIVCNNSLFLFL